MSRVLYRNYPQNDGYALAYARDLYQDKRRDEAHQVFATLAAAGVVRENIGVEVGRACLDLGDPAFAREYLEQAVAEAPLDPRVAPARLSLAELDLAAGWTAGARQELRAAYREPACADMKPLAHYLCATVPAGSENVARLSGRDFPLTAVQRARLLLLLDDALAAAGRGEDARELITTHPEWLTLAPPLAGKLGKALLAGNDEALGKWVSLVEGVAVQADPPCPGLNRQLASLYVAWADQDTVCGVGKAISEAAFTRLMRAHALDPENFALANRLARLQMDRKQDADVQETLRGFLSADALPEEHAEAARTLHKG